ncbi:phage holin family protein [Patescibacteria group bacterium]|nr:phage holin family protein [Patescibacteria group bacterium]
MEGIIALFGTGYLKIIGILIAIDVLFGIIAAITRKEFVFRKLAMFMKGPVLVYIFGFVILELYGKAFPTVENWILWIGFILIAIALLGSIFRNLGRLGLPLPGTLRKE